MTDHTPCAPTAAADLSGIRVVDLSRLVAGNIASHILCDLGADVIKVESPKGGDSLRNWTCGGVETWWKVYGRGKRSLALDLRAPEAPEILTRLIHRADILIENFRPGTLEKMGFAPQRLWEINPKLSILRISAWGQDGPFAHKPGFGSLVEAYAGFASMNGFDDRPPVLPPFAMADCFSGVFGVVGLLTTLRAAEATGRGAEVDLSLLESLFSILGPITLEASLTGRPVQRQGSRSPTHAPRNVYETRDGRFVALSAGTEAMVKRLFDAMGRADLAVDPRFATHAGRIANIDALDAEIAAFTRTLDRASCLELFERTDVTVGPVMDGLDLLHDPFMRARGALIDQPDRDLGAFASPAPPIRISGCGPPVLRPAPALGEHTDAILSELGLSPPSPSNGPANADDRKM